jgi:YD repeat-containing protein
VTDSANHTTTIDLDPSARTETITSPSGHLVTINSYDTFGNLTRTDQTGDGRTLTWRFGYDPDGRPNQAIDPHGHQTSAVWDDHGNLTDVRAECPNCRPLVELEAAGCRTWELTPRSFARVAHEIDRLKPWVFTKGYWQTVGGKLQVVGLRVGERPNHVVAFWGDWIIRHPDGHFTVHRAPAEAAS